MAESDAKLSYRHKQILSLMDEGIEYSTDMMAELVRSKGSRTKQLLNELVDLGQITASAATKNRRYIKKVQ